MIPSVGLFLEAHYSKHPKSLGIKQLPLQSQLPSCPKTTVGGSPTGFSFALLEWGAPVFGVRESSSLENKTFETTDSKSEMSSRENRLNSAVLKNITQHTPP